MQRSNSCESSNSDSIRRANLASLLAINGTPPPKPVTTGFSCSRCSGTFPTTQSLGGHQNAHKRERIAEQIHHHQIANPGPEPEIPIITAHQYHPQFPVFSPQPISAIPPAPYPVHQIINCHSVEADQMARVRQLIAYKFQLRKSLYGSVYGDGGDDDSEIPPIVPPSPDRLDLKPGVQFSSSPFGNEVYQKTKHGLIFKKRKPTEMDIESYQQPGNEDGGFHDPCVGTCGFIMENEFEAEVNEMDLTLKL